MLHILLPILSKPRRHPLSLTRASLPSRGPPWFSSFPPKPRLLQNPVRERDCFKIQQDCQRRESHQRERRSERGGKDEWSSVSSSADSDGVARNERTPHGCEKRTWTLEEKGRCVDAEVSAGMCQGDRYRAVYIHTYVCVI